MSKTPEDNFKMRAEAETVFHRAMKTQRKRVPLTQTARFVTILNKLKLKMADEDG